MIAAIDQIAAGVAEADNAALCVLVDDESQAEAWRARGARLILFSAVSLIAQRLRAVAGAVYTPREIDAVQASRLIDQARHRQGGITPGPQSSTAG